MASHDWFLRHNDGEVHGPFTLQQLIDAALVGSVAFDTEVMSERHTSGRWILASRIKQIAAAMASMNVPQAPPAEPRPAGNRESDGQPDVDSFHVKTVDRPRHAPMIVPSTIGAAFFAIFDFRFRYYITPWIIRIQWAVFVTAVVLLMAIVTFTTIVAPFAESLSSNLPDTASSRASRDNTDAGSRSSSAWAPQPPSPSVLPGWIGGVGKFVASKLGQAAVLLFFFGGCIASLLYVRLILESAIVFFRIAEDIANVHDIAKRFRKETRRSSE
ncbi:hypothetical protein K227x_05870 [Rubripirellula lacrimiformis]|uniref:GYF domain-containing protein n=1 Tax=Rubripirellula lacrimiformis TaxID=1930273 RepID=A0A517N509_9BACT|nr:DUF4282 domain-containing protein [Rubripirellula lacrimiformis]QDT02215.1 hypothetical protein K227x_05870 [Rubripirellula lacrimiformis]